MSDAVPTHSQIGEQNIRQYLRRRATITEVATEPCKLCKGEMHGGALHDRDTLNREVRQGVCDGCNAQEIAASEGLI